MLRQGFMERRIQDFFFFFFGGGAKDSERAAYTTGAERHLQQKIGVLDAESPPLSHACYLILILKHSVMQNGI